MTSLKRIHKVCHIFVNYGENVLSTQKKKSIIYREITTTGKLIHLIGSSHVISNTCSYEVVSCSINTFCVYSLMMAVSHVQSVIGYSELLITENHTILFSLWFQLHNKNSETFIHFFYQKMVHYEIFCYCLQWFIERFRSLYVSSHNTSYLFW